MSATKLVYQANQIATFFETQPGDDPAAGVAAHINKFWEPRMRRKLAEILAAEESALNPLVIRAASHIHFPQAAS
ncbi:formate dehydrogenase subunit delta [Breoghania sp.]|uniref:formate dehydrogenase subunit delta n=1 Tax=Breoghania sp. TaxID=2065378 RepID=UPI002AA945DD|nr:formate dehydrogenase subunit delta [Breoghania sp.]